MVIARYTITSGLSGCYMPNNVSNAQAYKTRKELADAIRSEIECQDFPKSAFNQVRIRNLWSKIVYADSASSMHFSIEHGAFEIAFHGMTEEEYNDSIAQEEYA